MKNEIRDAILAVFNLFVISEPNELNNNRFRFTINDNTLTLERYALGSNTTYSFTHSNYNNENCAFRVEVENGEHSWSKLSRVPILEVTKELRKIVSDLTSDVDYYAKSLTSDLEEFTDALEGRADKEIFAFVNDVRSKLHRAEYRNYAPLHLTSYTNGIPDLTFSRNNVGEIVCTVEPQIRDAEPTVLSGELLNLPNIKLAIKNQYGLWKDQHLAYMQTELQRTIDSLDHIDAQ